MTFLDPITWFTYRRLEFKPTHFVLAKTPVTAKSIAWIATTLNGRYSLVTMMDEDYQKFQVPAFEDPGEAVLYELTWS
jgi:hypothetical protein